MDQIIDRRMSAEDARKWLADVARRERQKIDQLKFTRRVLSEDPADDQAHDAATAKVWKFLKEEGLNADPTALTAALPEILVPKAALALDLAKRDLKSPARHKILLSEAERLLGYKPETAMDRVQLLALLIAGKAEAWGAKVKSTASESTDRTAEPVIEGQPNTSSRRKKVDPAPAHLSPMLNDITARMIALKESEGVEEKTLRSYQSLVKLFTTLTRISDVRQIRQSNVSEFRAMLARLPKSWGKSPSDHTMSREDILDKAAALPAEKVGLAVGTVNRHLEHLNQIIEWASDEGIEIDSRLKPTKLRRKEVQRERDRRSAFTHDDLRKLFSGPVWTGSKSAYYQTDTGEKIFKNGLYWVPLLGAYTGARREELAGLSPGDIQFIEGTACINITDSSLRRVKNAASRRTIPIHSRLIELGFLDHVEKARAAGRKDLFPDLAEQSQQNHGRKLGRKFRMAIDKTLGPEAASLSFHSLRHYVQTELEAIGGIPDKVIRDIIGHEGKDVHERVYSKASSVAMMTDAIEKLPRLL